MTVTNVRVHLNLELSVIGINLIIALCIAKYLSFCNFALCNLFTVLGFELLQYMYSRGIIAYYFQCSPIREIKPFVPKSKMSDPNPAISPNMADGDSKIFESDAVTSSNKKVRYSLS